MDYLNNAQLEDMSASELLEYYKNLLKHKQILLDEVTTWATTFLATKRELQHVLTKLEEELILAQFDREDSGWALNNNLLDLH